MLDLFHCSPSVGSIKAEPLSISEIDAHSDSDRIWSTIKAMRVSAQQEINDAEFDVDDIEYQASGDQLAADNRALTIWSKEVIEQLGRVHANELDVPAVKFLVQKIKAADGEAL